MKISEVSEVVDLSAHTLRYYEKIGLLHPISKNSSGIREYTKKDVSRLQFIKCMREADVSIKTLKEYIHLYDSNSDTLTERRELLMNEYQLMQEKYLALKDGLLALEQKAELLDEDILDLKLKNTKRGEK